MISSAMYVHVRGRQLEGTFPGDRTTGCWILTAQRIGKGWGMPKDETWPYDASKWPPVEPAEIDVLAKRSRVFTYTRARSIHECKVLLNGGCPIVAGFTIDSSWFNAHGGFIPLPLKSDVIIGGHAIVLAGYNERSQCFTFRNTWGTKWGDRDYGYLPYEYFENRLMEAWTVRDFSRPKRDNVSKGISLNSWAAQELLGGWFYCFEIIDDTHDEVIGWTFALERDGHYEVEELFVRPQWRHQGYGGKLANALVKLAATNNRPLKLWVSHVDANHMGLPQNLSIMGRLGLKLCPTTESWASAIGLPSSNTNSGILPITSLRTGVRMLSFLDPTLS